MSGPRRILHWVNCLAFAFAALGFSSSGNWYAFVWVCIAAGYYGLSTCYERELRLRS